MLHDHVTCDCDMCDHTVTCVTYLLCFVTCVTVIYNITSYFFTYKFKIIKIKTRIKQKKKKKKKEKKRNSNLMFTILTL